MESFVLERLRSETSLSSGQFGGIKGCGTEHFLIETWDAIIRSLEEGNYAANVLSVDFEKAFNRMDHLQCLYAINDLGASEHSIDLVAAFLFGRQMSVKIRDCNLPRAVLQVDPHRGPSWGTFYSVPPQTNLPSSELIYQICLQLGLLLRTQ